MTLIIENVKEEYFGAFKEFAEKMDANIAESTHFAESSAESSQNLESNECPICKYYDYEPSERLLEAIAEVRRGEVVRFDNYDDAMKYLDS